jgi:hypothetical protein
MTAKSYISLANYPCWNFSEGRNTPEISYFILSIYAGAELLLKSFVSIPAKGLPIILSSVHYSLFFWLLGRRCVLLTHSVKCRRLTVFRPAFKLQCRRWRSELFSLQIAMPAFGQCSFVTFGHEYVYLTGHVRPFWPMKFRKKWGCNFTR